MMPTDINYNLTRERLDNLFEINAERGTVTWRNPSNRRPSLRGKDAGHFGHRFGYVMIGIDGKDFKRHRLIWFYFHGTWPDEEVDHINGDRTDDRIGNLRQASKSQNMWNAKVPVTNTSGRKGVSWSKDKRRWRAKITVNGHRIEIGYFTEFDAAVAARETAERRYHGEFARAS